MIEFYEPGFLRLPWVAPARVRKHRTIGQAVQERDDIRAILRAQLKWPYELRLAGIRCTLAATGAAAVVLAVIVDDVFGVVEERVKPQENGELWADAVPAIASDAITSAVDARAWKRRLVCILIFRFSGRLMPEGARSETA